jgi:hypothetical protein
MVLHWSIDTYIIFTGLRSHQWELRCLVAVNHREVFNKRLPQICERKPLEAVIPVQFSRRYIRRAVC